MPSWSQLSSSHRVLYTLWFALFCFISDKMEAVYHIENSYLCNIVLSVFGRKRLKSKHTDIILNYSLFWKDANRPLMAPSGT